MWILDFLPFWVFHLIVAAGVATLFIAQFVKFIPFINTYRLPIQLVGIFLLICGIYMEGGVSNQERWEAKVSEAKIEIAKKETESAEATTKVVTKYVTKVQIVKEKGDVIVKEVPKYISKESDAKCPIPNSFVVLHDSAVKNEVPDSTRGVDETTSGVKLSTVTSTVTGNYSICHQNSEQLKALQEWVKEQEKIYNR